VTPFACEDLDVKITNVGDEDVAIDRVPDIGIGELGGSRARSEIAEYGGEAIVV
jgi:hypothetical protein